MARAVVSGSDKPFSRIAVVISLLQVPRPLEHAIVERWSIMGYKALSEYAPFVAHVLAVELFFQFALAAHLIGTERASNRVDIAYLNYLPFCMMFVSGDDLHRRCAPLFLRDDQRFVWAPDLKGDLANINSHFMGLSDSEKERGISNFAYAPPKLEGSMVRSLRAQFMGAGYDDQPPIHPPDKGDPASDKLVSEVSKWNEAATLPDDGVGTDDDHIEATTIQRSVKKRRGSWWQLPRDLLRPNPK